MADLDKVEPAVIDAQQAVKSIRKQHLVNICFQLPTMPSAVQIPNGKCIVLFWANVFLANKTTYLFILCCQLASMADSFHSSFNFSLPFRMVL